MPLQVQELTLSEDARSRAAAGAVTADGAAIGVFQLAFNGYMPSYNCPYTYSADGGWSSATPLFVDGRESKIVGVYDPNNVGAFPAGNTGTVSSTKLTAQAYDETKLWYFDDSHTDVNCLSASVSFTMKPVYSRIQLSIQRHATSYIGNCAITIPAAKFTRNALACGRHYTIELLMTDTGVSFTGVNLTEMGVTPTDPNIKFEPEID